MSKEKDKLRQKISTALSSIIAAVNSCAGAERSITIHQATKDIFNLFDEFKKQMKTRMKGE